MHTGATNQRVNHFTNGAISKYKNILSINLSLKANASSQKAHKEHSSMLTSEAILS